MSKLETNLTICGVVVLKGKDIGKGINVYSKREECEFGTETLYFVKGDECFSKLVITAECNQNEGFVSAVSFVDVG